MELGEIEPRPWTEKFQEFLATAPAPCWWLASDGASPYPTAVIGVDVDPKRSVGSTDIWKACSQLYKHLANDRAVYLGDPSKTLVQPCGAFMSSFPNIRSSDQPIAGPIDLRIVGRWAQLPLRLIVGYGFIAHGYAKLSRGPETFAAVLHTLGIPVPFLLAWMTTLVELIGGFAVLTGAFIPIVSLPMAVVLLTALFTIHLPYGFFSVKLIEVTESGTKFGTVGYEIILLYLASLAALVLGGAGPLSVDQWRCGRHARSQVIPASRRG